MIIVILYKNYPYYQILNEEDFSKYKNNILNLKNIFHKINNVVPILEVKK